MCLLIPGAGGVKLGLIPGAKTFFYRRLLRAGKKFLGSKKLKERSGRASGARFHNRENSVFLMPTSPSVERGKLGV